MDALTWIPLRSACCLLGLFGVSAVGGMEPLSIGGSGPRVGWETTVDAAFGLGGAARGGESLNALALAALEGQRPWGEAAGRSVSYRVSALALEGRGPTGRFVGDFRTVSNAEGHASARLYAWWAQLAAGGWSVRAGALLADEEFLVTGPGGELINASFGWPAFVSTNTVNTGPAFFAAAPGLRLEARPTSTLVWRAGVYDGDAFDSREGDPRVNRDGLSLRLGGDQGAFLITELKWAPPEGPWRGLAGGWWHTADFENLRDDEAGRPFALSGGAPRTHAGNGGLFVALERAWRGPAGEPGTIESHVRGGFSRRDRSPVAWAADVAVAWRGPHPARRGDALALGWSRARFSSALADTVRLAASGEAEPSFEEVVELSYTWVVSDSLTVQPDLQWIRRVGGTRDGHNALVGLVRLRWAR